MPTTAASALVEDARMRLPFDNNGTGPQTENNDHDGSASNTCVPAGTRRKKPSKIQPASWFTAHHRHFSLLRFLVGKEAGMPFLEMIVTSRNKRRPKRRRQKFLSLLLLSILFLTVQGQPSDPQLSPGPLPQATEQQQQQQYGPQQRTQQQQQQQQQQSPAEDPTTQEAYKYGLASTASGDYNTLMDHSAHILGGTTGAVGGAGSPGSDSYPVKSLIINIPSLGKLQGKRDAGVDFYGGIPYAAPPVGQLRFAPPEPPPPWAPVLLDSTHYGPDCWQLEDPVMNPGARHEFMSEDCLTLNIFTPAGHARRVGSGGSGIGGGGGGVGGLFGGGAAATNAKLQQDKLLPVLVWLHGGAFQQGGARRPEYNGYRLAERDVIVVTLNYRLGALGFLVSSTDGLTGNFGLMDQRAALHFVNDNIVHFGGDPSRVTLFGESAGAVMTGQHLMMEGAGTLFQAAIMQSNPLGYLFRSVVIADFIGEALKRSVDCRDLECLRAERVEEIMLAQKSLMGVPRSVSDVFTWGPTLTQERSLHVGGSSSSGSVSRRQLNLNKEGLLVAYDDIQHQRRRRNKGKRARDAYAVNVTQPLKSLHLIPDAIPIIIGSNKHEGEMFIHSAFPITMSKPVYWMFVGALFRDSASRVLKHYREYVDQIEEEANELARKQVEEEANKLYYLEHQKQLEEEYEMLLAMNASRRVVRDRGEDFKALLNAWSPGGGQDPYDDSKDKTASAARSNAQWYSNIFHPWRGQSEAPSESDASQGESPPAQKNAATNSLKRDNLGVDYSQRSMPPMHRIKKILNMFQNRIPFLEAKDPIVEARKAAGRELKRKARAKEKALKEAAKVVVDYRPVMSRIINDYLFRCPSWHYADALSRNRVQNNTVLDDTQSGTGAKNAKHKSKRTRNNNNVYVYRFSQPTHIPGYKECWGKSCHTAELPYVFEAMSIIRSHYSTLGPFAQAEAPVAPEYPYTDVLTAYQGALEEMEEEDTFGEDEEGEDLMWKGSNTRKPHAFSSSNGRGGDQAGINDEEASTATSLPRRSLLANHSNSRAQRNNNVPDSKAFQRVLKNMFGDYFVEDADEEIAADMAERWVSFAKHSDPNYDGSKAIWRPWRYWPSPTTETERSEIPWQPQEFEYMDDDLEEDDEMEDTSAASGFRWSEDRSERIYRKRALKALGMEVIEEDLYRTELRRMPTVSELNEMEAVFTFLFGNAKSNSQRRRQQKDASTKKMSKEAIRQVQKIAQAMGVVGTGLRGEPSRSSNARFDDDFFPEMLDLKWPPEGRLVERDCTCDLWERIRCKCRHRTVVVELFLVKISTELLFRIPFTSSDRY
jgi:carboxylesterase type B